MDMIILETRSEVNVNQITETQKWYATFPHPKMHLLTKVCILPNIFRGFALDTVILDTRSEAKVTVTKISTQHSVILRCIYTPSLNFLPQIM